MPNTGVTCGTGRTGIRAELWDLKYKLELSSLCSQKNTANSLKSHSLLSITNSDDIILSFDGKGDDRIPLCGTCPSQQRMQRTRRSKCISIAR